MSILKVDTIQKADGTGSLSVPAESGTVVTTASPSLGRRNLIINGAMQVAQRGTSFTLGAGTGTYTLDRVRSQSNGGGITVSQEANAISGIGTQKMCRYTGASGVTGVYYIYRVESKDVAQINGNSVTFSIYVENNSGASISPTIDYYHPTAADNFSGNTTVASGVSLGTVANGSSTRLTATTDVSGTTITNGLMIQVSFGSALTSGTIDFTGVQLEVGSVATPFEHRSYGEELALCQRYYWKIPDDPSTNHELYMGIGNASQSLTVPMFYPTPMRVRPTCNVLDTTPYWEYSPYNTVGTSLTISSVNMGHSGLYGGELGLFGTFSPTVNRGDNYVVDFGEVLEFDAEL